MVMRPMPLKAAWKRGKRQVTRLRRRIDKMATLILKCPHCGVDNDVPTQAVVIRCGFVYCKCTCRNCSQEFDSQQEYWQWLGLTEAPPAELDV